jgi:Tfp pilus assembly protein PilX
MRIWSRLRKEDGIALVLSLGVGTILAMSGTTLAYYSMTNARSATVSKSKTVAYSFAEAGIGEALSKLNNALNPLQANLLAETTVPMDGGGSVTYSGTLNGYVWSIVSTGTVINPSGAGGGALTRRLTRTAQVYGVNDGASVSAWSRMYHDNVSTCLTIEDVDITFPVASRGDICMRGSATITGAQTTVEAGDDITMTSTEPVTGTARSAGAGAGWPTSPGNIVSSNNQHASTTVAGNTQSANLDATGFGFTIPADATITGIQASIERSASHTSSIDDQDVYLLLAGATRGSDKGKTSTYWGTSDQTSSYGGSTDLWTATWTPADVNASTFGVRVKADNDNGSSRSAFVDHIQITVWYRPAPPISIGSSGAPVDKVHVAGHCQYGGQVPNSPCSVADKVYANTSGTTPEALSKPAIDLDYWYANAKPGPMQNCTTGTFPGGFDNDGVYNNSRVGSPEVTPTNSSYTCQVKDAQGVLLGELSWNHLTHVLTIKGTVFVDGDFRFDDDGQIVHYVGRGIIYAAGDIEFDELVCAGGSGTTSCVDTGMSNWDPTVNLMIVLAGGDSEFDQGATQSQPVPSGLQGIIYARDDCTIHENFHLSGPIVCDAIVLPDHEHGWPTYYMWPPLGTLVDGQIYANPDTAGDFLVVPGNQSG